MSIFPVQGVTAVSSDHGREMIDLTADDPDDPDNPGDPDDEVVIKNTLRENTSAPKPARTTLKAEKKIHSCYVLYGNNKTYVGYTVNPKRRLRQHNGEITGGARYTRQMHGDARFLAIVSPFVDQRTALQFEWAMKKRKPRRHFLSGRARKICELLCTKQWTKKAIPTSRHPPLTVRWFLSEEELEAKTSLCVHDFTGNYRTNVSHIFNL
jgi:structure-specific endonuclease subunit SLX1